MKEIFKKILPEERKKYNKILEEFTDQNEERPLKSTTFVKLSKDVELTNDIIRNRVVLRKGRHSLDIISLLPDGFEFIFHPFSQKYNSTLKAVFYTNVLDELDLFGLLHEIGHAWVYVKNPDLYYDEINTAIIERNAWAWALKQMKKLRDEGYVSDKVTNEKLMDIVKACLYSYAKHYNEEKLDHTEDFLKRKMSDKDVFK
jgi:hypothetical protein